jgi:putative hydrolase of the HAD superfamily
MRRDRLRRIKAPRRHAGDAAVDLLSGRLTLTTIADADDTLWQNEHFYRLTEDRFLDLLGEHGDRAALSARLLEAEKRNLGVYGFGITGFTLSMIETAIEITNGRVSAATISEILMTGREMPATRSRRCLMRETLEAWRRPTASSHHQGRPVRPRRKLAIGLGSVRGRDRVEGRTSTPTAGSCRTAMSRQLAPLRHRAGPSPPELNVYVPHELNWALEHDDEPVAAPRYRRLDHIGGLPPLLAEIGPDRP